MLRFSEGLFSEGFISTIGVDFRIKKIEVDQSKVKLMLWDTAGQERFRSITNRYYRGNECVIVTYDITNRKSFENVAYWMQQIDNYGSANTLRILVANKTDLKEKSVVTVDEGKDIAHQFGIPFFETSAKDDTNIETMFCELTRTLLRRSQKKFEPVIEPTILKSKKISNTCC